MSTLFDPQWVRDYYDASGIKEWERWDLHPVARVKYALEGGAMSVATEVAA